MRQGCGAGPEPRVGARGRPLLLTVPGRGRPSSQLSSAWAHWTSCCSQRPWWPERGAHGWHSSSHPRTGLCQACTHPGQARSGVGKPLSSPGSGLLTRTSTLTIPPRHSPSLCPYTSHHLSAAATLIPYPPQQESPRTPSTQLAPKAWTGLTPLKPPLKGPSLKPPKPSVSQSQVLDVGGSKICLRPRPFPRPSGHQKAGAELALPG